MLLDNEPHQETDEEDNDNANLQVQNRVLRRGNPANALRRPIGRQSCRGRQLRNRNVEVGEVRRRGRPRRNPNPARRRSFQRNVSPVNDHMESDVERSPPPSPNRRQLRQRTERAATIQRESDEENVLIPSPIQRRIPLRNVGPVNNHMESDEERSPPLSPN